MEATNDLNNTQAIEQADKQSAAAPSLAVEGLRSELPLTIEGPSKGFDGYIIHGANLYDEIATLINRSDFDTGEFAAFIVRVVNAHDELLEACQFVKSFFNKLEDDGDYDDPLTEARKRYRAPIHAVLDAAIAKATGDNPMTTPQEQKMTAQDEAKHSLLPWKISGATIIWSPSGKATVAEVSEPRGCDTVRFMELVRGSKDFDEACANAEFIVKACNAHDDLLSALERARGCMGRLAKGTPERALAETFAEIDAAIAKAKGESK